MEVVSTTGLTKKFGSFTAVENVSITVHQGEIFGFLGLNGAGKTTLIRMLLGMIKPDKGHVSIFNKNVTSGFTGWNDIGYLVEIPQAYPNLSVRENLKIFYKLRNLTRPYLLDEIIEKLQLTAHADTKAGVLSMGNQQRLGLAKALMHKPKLLILDEPINGLDPEGIVEIRNFLKDLSKEGSTIFISSHILAEISKIADRIGIIHKGKLIKEVETTGLANELTKKLVLRTTDDKRALELLKQQYINAVLAEENEIEVCNMEEVYQPEHISKLLSDNNIYLKHLSQKTEDLEMYFLRTIHMKNETISTCIAS